MFEYLMPLLVMPTYEHTLLDQTYQAAVRRQIAYGKQRGVPWGISESGYNTIDAHMNYQYRAFGVPGLGLKRGLAEDLVIAPYASALALMVAPEAACANLERLAAEGRQGAYGLYEAIDYTPSRLPSARPADRLETRGTAGVNVRQFMAHHEGMSFWRWRICSWTSRCSAASRPIRCCTPPTCCFRNACPRPSHRSSRTSRKPASRGAPRSKRKATMRVFTDPERSGPRGPSALQRPIPRGDHQRRRRLQPLARSGRDALAGRRRRAIASELSAICAIWTAAPFGPRPGSQRSSRPNATRRYSRSPAPSFAAATTGSTRIRKSASRPRTTSSCGGSRSRTDPKFRAPSN